MKNTFRLFSVSHTKRMRNRQQRERLGAERVTVPAGAERCRATRKWVNLKRRCGTDQVGELTLLHWPMSTKPGAHYITTTVGCQNLIHNFPVINRVVAMNNKAVQCVAEANCIIKQFPISKQHTVALATGILLEIDFLRGNTFLPRQSVIKRKATVNKYAMTSLIQ